MRPLLQHLADVAGRAEGHPARAVPELALHALGDQLAVLARDVLRLAGSPGAPGSAPAGARLDDAALVDVADRLTALRRALP